MLRISLVVSLLCAVFMFPLVVGASVKSEVVAPDERPVDATRRTIERADELLGDNNLSAAAVEIDAAIGSVGFSGLSANEQHAVLSAGGRVAFQQGANEKAQRLATRATGFEVANGGDWHIRLYAGYAIQDYADNARCLATIATRWPQTLGQITTSAIGLIVNSQDEPATQATYFELLDSLFAARWTDSGFEPNEFWFEFARLLLARNDVDKAATVVARIESARVVLAMRIDRRFDRLARANPQAFDVDRVAAKQLARARDRVDAAPDRLQPVMYLQNLLIGHTNFEEALAIGNEVIARVKERDGAVVYTDFAEYYSWILDCRSRALRGLGRWDEAVEQQRQAARRPEGGRMNVSQALNLGAFLASLDRSAEALEAVSELGSVSPYGRMVLETIRLAATLGHADQKDAELHLAYLREHRADAISAYQEGLLDMGRLDAAADLLVERLRSETWRNDALVEMQEYLEVKQAPRARARNARWRMVIERPRVQAELAKVGRVERVNLGPPFG